MVQGVNELNRKLKVTMPARVKKAARLAMEKGAEEVVAMMKRLAPIDSGDLQMSISWTWGKAPKGSVVVAKSEPDEDGMGITIFAGSKAAYYARWVEFGSSKRRAHPFFFPAWRTKRKSVRSRITREMKKAVEASD